MERSLQALQGHSGQWLPALQTAPLLLGKPDGLDRVNFSVPDLLTHSLRGICNVRLKRFQPVGWATCAHLWSSPKSPTLPARHLSCCRLSEPATCQEPTEPYPSRWRRTFFAAIIIPPGRQRRPGVGPTQMHGPGGRWCAARCARLCIWCLGGGA